jgi:hypothetical protein
MVFVCILFDIYEVMALWPILFECVCIRELLSTIGSGKENVSILRQSRQEASCINPL